MFDLSNNGTDWLRKIRETQEVFVKLDIREGDVGYFTTGTAKRFIADRRNQGE